MANANMTQGTRQTAPSSNDSAYFAPQQSKSFEDGHHSTPLAEALSDGDLSTLTNVGLVEPLFEHVGLNKLETTDLVDASFLEITHEWKRN